MSAERFAGFDEPLPFKGRLRLRIRAGLGTAVKFLLCYVGAIFVGFASWCVISLVLVGVCAIFGWWTPEAKTGVEIAQHFAPFMAWQLAYGLFWLAVMPLTGWLVGNVVCWLFDDDDHGPSGGSGYWQLTGMGF